MWPTLFKIPWLELPIRSYGLMLMIGFLGGTWWAARRAARTKCDPDLVINLGFAALVSSVVGARAFYVIHYWDRSFAGRGFRAVIDITAGGMEFYGGLIGAMVAVLAYLAIKRVSLRLYLDIVAPSLMFGMGMARIGCFLNGCCWGGACGPELAWGVRFPYASPAFHRQWEDRQVTVPAELIVVFRDGTPALLPRDFPEEVPEPLRRAERELEAAERALAGVAGRGADAGELERLTQARDRARKAWREQLRPGALSDNQARIFDLTHASLAAMARHPSHRTQPVHPAQLYASAGGFLLAWLLNALFYRRRRHGVVVGVLFLTYPVMRIVEEIIRVDNPHDAAGLTASQFVSLLLLAMGAGWMIAIRRLPLRSPKAVPFKPPWEEARSCRK